MYDSIYNRFGYTTYSGTVFSTVWFELWLYLASLNIQEKTMITSDEEQEYGIFSLLSDVGGGLGIFLGLSFLRLVSPIFKSFLISF